jgi:nicotinate-nucleotide adenylyltransferase
MRLGLNGGAFNPIHRCHLIVAEAVYRRLRLDRVLFIPTGDPPHKPPSEFFPAVHRLEMVRLAIAPFPYFQLSDIETRRASKSYSIDTIKEIKEAYPADTELVFILGLDAFLELPTWKEPAALLAACDFAVVSRPGVSFESMKGMPFLSDNAQSLLGRLDSGVEEAVSLPLTTGRSVWTIPIPPCNVSAQDIRRRLRKKQNLENSLPPQVESYILRVISG